MVPESGDAASALLVFVEITDEEAVFG